MYFQCKQVEPENAFKVGLQQTVLYLQSVHILGESISYLVFKMIEIFLVDSLISYRSFNLSSCLNLDSNHNVIHLQFLRP